MSFTEKNPVVFLLINQLLNEGDKNSLIEAGVQCFQDLPSGLFLLPNFSSDTRIPHNLSYQAQTIRH